MISLRRSAELRKIRVSPPNWAIAFGREQPALEVDLGCGRGTYAYLRAATCPEASVVALEMKRKWVSLLRERARRAGLPNLRAIRCDVSEDLPLLFAERSVGLFTIHHPDPWWKKKHRRRRMVRPALVVELARLLRPGGHVFLQTDVPDLAAEMRAVFDSSGLFTEGDADRFQDEQLAGLRSHREGKCLQRGIPIQRLLYARTA